MKLDARALRLIRALATVLVLSYAVYYVYSHREWAAHHNLQFALLSDHNHDVARLYQSYNSKTGYNLRSVYVIDRSGKIAYIDLAFKAGSPESFAHLRTAVEKVK